MEKFDPRIEFHCPKCLSTHFGTTATNNWANATGHCNGHSCKFTWPRAEDWKVFYIVEVTKFETKEEFLASRKEIGF